MTEMLVRRLAAVLDDCSPEEVSCECYDLRDEADQSITLDDECVAVLGMPVYVGKIPVPAAEALSRVKGKGAMTLAAVSYGGMSYGNALYELQHRAEENDLSVIGAGAFMVSYRAIRGSQRSAAPMPDAEAIADFVKAASGKIRRLAGCEIEGLKIKPMPVEVEGKMPVHNISRISPKAAAVAQGFFDMMSLMHRKSEWFL